MRDFFVPRDMLLCGSQAAMPTDFSVRGFSAGQGEAMATLTVTVSAVAGGTLWTPSGITTALWLDAADTDTITLNGSTVSQWADKSGNNRHAVQGAAVAQPTRLGAAIGGLPALSFDGTDDALDLASQPVTGITPRTLFVVARPDGFTNTGVFGVANVSSGLGTLWDICLEAGQIAVRVANNAIYATTISTSLAGIFGISWASGTAFSTIVRHNGAAISRTGGVDATVNTVSGTARIGRTQGQSKYFDGLIAEVVLAPAALDVATQQKIEGYLAHKWGLTANLPSNHPYKSAAPTI